MCRVLPSSKHNCIELYFCRERMLEVIFFRIMLILAFAKIASFNISIQFDSIYFLKFILKIVFDFPIVFIFFHFGVTVWKISRHSFLKITTTRCTCRIYIFLILKKRTRASCAIENVGRLKCAVLIRS